MRTTGLDAGLEAAEALGLGLGFGGDTLAAAGAPPPLDASAHIEA